jgi:hypothetical protein
MEGEGEGRHVLVTLGKSTSGYKSWEQLLDSDVADTSITHRCFLDISIGGEAVGGLPPPHTHTHTPHRHTPARTAGGF